MVIDRQRALAAFQKYTGNYDITDEKVKLKNRPYLQGMCAV